MSDRVGRAKVSLDRNWEAQFIRCEQAGMTASQIATRFGVTTRTVQRWRASLGVTHRQSVAYPQRVHSQIEQLVDGGCPIKEAARTVGVSATTAYRWLPDRERWTRSQVGEYAAMIRQFGRVA